jgi:5'-nucleotidase/UDP-sugar diphosphatase
VINPESGKLIAEVSKAAGGARKAEVETNRAAAPEGSGKYYEVRSGDSLYKIAKKHGTTVDELVKLNNLKDAKHIYPGRKLLLPGK